MQNSGTEECVYEGEWKNGKLNCDNGTLKQSDGGVYKGPFLDNMRHGDEGKYIWPNNQGEYVGRWQKGQR